MSHSVILGAQYAASHCRLFITLLVSSTVFCQNTSSHRGKPLIYADSKYGFCLSLPDSWSGYVYMNSEWSGTVYDRNRQQGGPTVHGPMVRITNQDGDHKWQDIPIMIFTSRQWRSIVSNNLVVSAAPYPPGEIGRSSKFVFALPPRYISDDETVNGIRDVVQLFQGHPFRATCKTRRG